LTRLWKVLTRRLCVTWQVEKHFPDGTKEITHAGGKTIMRQEQSANHTLGGSHGNGKARSNMNAMPRAAYAPAE
jgi:hypothetical protein